MGLFDPAALPELLVEAIRFLVNGRNVVASEDYEYDLLIFIDCWVQCQNEDFKSFLNAPEDAKPPSRIVTSRRATSVIYDLFGDPPASRGESIALFALRPTARWLYDLHQTRPRLVLREVILPIQTIADLQRTMLSSSALLEDCGFINSYRQRPAVRHLHQDGRGQPQLA